MPNDQLNVVEQWLERLLFAGRWLMAPIYVGLVLILAAITTKFVEEIALTLPSVLSMQERDLVLLVLSLIDLALLGSLTLMVAFAGYENFVSKMHSVRGHEDRPDWMGQVDFSGLKIKLIGSIVAISAIHLLRTFLNVSAIEKEDVGWQLAIHLGFVVSGLLLALMDRFGAATPHPLARSISTSPSRRFRARQHGRSPSTTRSDQRKCPRPMSPGSRPGRSIPRLPVLAPAALSRSL